MKFYIATAHANFEAAIRIREFIDTLDHEVVSTWHDEDIYEESLTDQGALMKKAVRDYRQLMEATGLILIAHPDCRASLTELGIALGRDIPVYVIGMDIPGIFTHLSTLFVRHFPNEKTFIYHIGG